MTNIAMNTQLK